MSFDELPKDCIAQILSCTSPKDACQFSLLSKYIGDAAESDLLWEKFLPLDYKDITSRSVSSLPLTSNLKDLFLQLSGPLLIDDGKKIFWMEKCGGNKKICYALGARDLSISWATDPLCWSWKYFLPSRFPEIAELIMVHWLEIRGNINTKLLSPNTNYAAYLIIKIAGRAYGLHTLPSQLSIQVVGNNDFNSNATTSLKSHHEDQDMLTTSTSDEDEKEKLVHERKDGWLEIELGEFYNDATEKDVKMSFKEVQGVHLKGGLILEGIEIRPKP